MFLCFGTMKKISVLVCLIFIASLFCVGEDSDMSSSSPDEKFNLFGSGEIFKLNPVSDTLLFVAGAGVLTFGLVMENRVQFPKFEDRSTNKNDVNVFDRWAMRQYSKTLDTLGTVTDALAIASPLSIIIPMTFTASGRNELFTVGVMYAEAFILEEGIKELIKNLVLRARPYSYFDGVPEKHIESRDWTRSFPSGHTSESFLGATFTSFVFSSYYPDSPWKIPVIAGSYALAVTTAVLRMASGNHFFTDVLTGAAIGSVIGVGIPLLHKIGLNPKQKFAKGRSLELSVSPVMLAANLRL